MGHAFQSDLRRWEIVAGLCQSIDARTYVEVGCKAGETVGHVLRECPQIRAIAIDPWCEQPPSEDVTRETYEGWNFEKIETQFWKSVGESPRQEPIRPWSNQRCIMLRMTSAEAVEKFETGIGESASGFDLVIDRMNGSGINMPIALELPSVDIVFIDALHDHESVKQDIALWWPLVRQGGYLAGHDFQHKFPGVMRAVAEHFNLMDVCLGPDSMWWVQKPAAARASA